MRVIKDHIKVSSYQVSGGGRSDTIPTEEETMPRIDAPTDPDPAESSPNPPAKVRDYTGSDVTPSMEAVAVALAAGYSLEEAAEKGRRTVPTVKLWLRTKPEFKRRIAELREDLTDRTLGLLAAASADAVKTLTGLLTDESGALRHRASDSLLGHALKYREVEELKGQLQSLLSQLDAAERKGKPS
jgi:hypothetical protein